MILLKFAGSLPDLLHKDRHSRDDFSRDSTLYLLFIEMRLGKLKAGFVGTLTSLKPLSSAAASVTS